MYKLLRNLPKHISLEEVPSRGEETLAINFKTRINAQVLIIYSGYFYYKYLNNSLSSQIYNYIGAPLKRQTYEDLKECIEVGYNEGIIFMTNSSEKRNRRTIRCDYNKFNDKKYLAGQKLSEGSKYWSINKVKINMDR